MLRRLPRIHLRAFSRDVHSREGLAGTLLAEQALSTQNVSDAPTTADRPSAAAAASVSKITHQPSFVPHLHRTFASASASADDNDLVRALLDAPSPSDPSHLIPKLKDVPASVLPEVARAAALVSVQDRSFKDALASAATRALPELSPADVTTLVAAMGDLGIYSVAFKDAIADRVLAMLSEFTGDQLGLTMRAFAASTYYDSDLLEGIAAHLLSLPATALSPCNVADMAYAFDKAGWCHPDLVTVVERTAERLLSEEGQKLATKECIAHMLDAVAHVGTCEPTDPEMVESLVAKAVETGSQLHGHSLAMVVNAAARLGCTDERLLCPLLDIMVEKMEELSPKALVKTVKALGEIGLRHKVFLDAVAEQQVPMRLGEFSPDGLSDLVDALNKLNYYSAEFLNTVQGGGKSGVTEAQN